MLSCIFVIFVLLFGTIQAATNVGGVLLANTVWTRSGSSNPYYLIKDLQIPRNVTLTIEHGVKVNFSQGDFEIFVKGFLKIQGTFPEPVIFEGGSANDLKWMIQFQSTQLSQSTITYAQFKGPKKALQTTNAAAGLQQNTDTLVVDSSKFLADTQIGANGNYPRYSFPSVPALEFRSCSLTQTTVTSANGDSEPIRIINSNIFYGTFYPRAANEGVQIMNCSVRNLTINYDSDTSSQFQILTSNVMNASVIFPSNRARGNPTITVRRSVIRDFAILFGDNIYDAGPYLIFEDSSMYNISTAHIYSNPWYNNYYYYLTIGLSIRNCKFTLGNLTTSTSYSRNSVPISITDSVLNKVHIISSDRFNDNNYAQTPFTMRNVSFIDGTLNLPLRQADISYSTITLLSPPLSIGASSRISCSSIGRSGSILQTITTGIRATGLTLTNSTIKNFAVGLLITPPSLNTATISQTNFYSNSQYNINNIGAYNVSATGVYWGTNNVGVIINKILDYWDDIYYGEVIYTNYSTNYLAAETGCPALQSGDLQFTTWSPYPQA